MKHYSLATAAIGALLLGGTLTAADTARAGALFTLKGQTIDTRLATESEVRVSVLEWTKDDKAKEVAERFRQAQTGDNKGQFAKFLAKQDTVGYVFTPEPIGYSVKYAWQSEGPTGKQVVLAITPALKSYNPYLWKQTNSADQGYTLLELRYQGEEALVHASFDAPVELNLQGKLELQDDTKTRVFARLRDDTPYYLKHS